MLGNLTGWHLMIVAAIVLVIVAVVIVAIVLTVVLSRRGSSSPDNAAATGIPSPETRMREIERLRQRGVITDAEYEAKRAEIIGRI
ncbi:c-type cytochrome biogenesis protein CcmI [Paramicrobacterium fandaimingii]|uniref:c-type cytochrome biogenesis protein CcmI n=1 Tax=Paramicrobacterium fandaimingii TaxID=2708079 RepID=UPI00141E18FE|nr:c-type cytochrome biogenesis protein CcmI [Microbacterium fandaimingii]